MISLILAAVVLTLTLVGAAYVYTWVKLTIKNK